MMTLRREIDRGVGVGLGRALIALMSGFDGAPAMKPLNYQVVRLNNSLATSLPLPK